jgi:hypothetical protein
MKYPVVTALILSLFYTLCLPAQEEAPAPPAVGEATAGTPAILPTDAAVDGEADPDDPRGLNEVTVAGGTETQYRRRGYIYELKMSPRGGATQYLKDDGDGQLQTRENGLEDTTNLPKWRIGKW